MEEGSMTDPVLVLTDNPVTVRDSWDILDTPRTSHSETDDITESQTTLRVDIKQSSAKGMSGTHSKSNRERPDNYNKKRSTKLRQNPCDDETDAISRCSEADTSKYQQTSVKSTRLRNVINTGYGESVTADGPSARKIIPRRYRRLGLRSHDEMLQEQFDKLRHLLHDSENMNREELNRRHIEQTRNMIADYKCVSGGAKARGIIVSRSLPESLRPKSPRSNSSSSFTSSRGGSTSYRSYSSSRSPSPGSKLSSRRVSFRKSPSRHQRSRNSSRISTSREPSVSPTQRSPKDNSSDSEDDERSLIDSYTEKPESHDDLVSHEKHSRRHKKVDKQSEGEETSGEHLHKDENLTADSCEPKIEPPRPSSRATDDSTCGDENKVKSSKNNGQKENYRISTVEQELSVRVARKKPKRQYQYVTEEKMTQNQRNRKNHESDCLVEDIEEPAGDTHGVVEDHNGVKHIDSNLRRTGNPDIKQWLKEKEKAIRKTKKKQKKRAEKEQAKKEREEQKQAERKAESEKKFREWQQTKKKEIRLLRRQNLAKRKLERKTSNFDDNYPTKQHVFPRNANSSPRPPAKRDITWQKEATVKPTAPPMPRPSSAPPCRKKFVRSGQVPLAQVIRNNPDLQEKLKQLEKQRQLKHRQSYDEWLRSKEKEKKDTLKIIREQRLKIEKDIREETARVISDAAKRRIDNVRYKGSTATQQEKQPPKEEDSKKAEDPEQPPYSWKHKSNHGERPSSANARPGFNRPASMSSPNRPQTSKRRDTGRPAVEETVATDVTTNPFRDPFKPPKLGRPKSKPEQEGIKGPEFSRFIWELVNEESGGNRPEPQGEDAPVKSKEAPVSDSTKLKEPFAPKPSASPTPLSKDTGSSKDKVSRKETMNDPIIESGATIFAMTSID